VIAVSEKTTPIDSPHPNSFREPRVTGFCYDEVFLPRVASMNLDWPDQQLSLEQITWNLPRGINILGPAPSRFGIQIVRLDTDSYTVRLVWNEMQCGWPCLTRAELLQSSLLVLLKVLGTNLEYLLDQPVQETAEM
jgi:hypothetical protein